MQLSGSDWFYWFRAWFVQIGSGGSGLGLVFGLARLGELELNSAFAA